MSINSLAVIGAQWGDEGKGKITDCLGAECDFVVRFQGGNNAGHTITVDGRKTVLHLVPSGILHARCVSVIGHGVVFDPGAFAQELVAIGGVADISPGRLRVSANCTVITAYNKLLDGLREAQGPVKIGTTGKGIGPAYEDKVARKAIKFRDLLDGKVLRTKLEQNLVEKRALFEHLYGVDYPGVEEEALRLQSLGEQLAPYLADTFSLIGGALRGGKRVLFEGAQGILLDIDYGSYPFVTSSNTSIGGIYTGVGLPGSRIDEVLGVSKAYTTRVGEGPFPTELTCETGRMIGQRGHEFGATTGRKRRCGWLDLPLLKYTVRASNLTSLALTKVDVLSGLESLKVCRGYRWRGEELSGFSPGIDLGEVEPVYGECAPFSDGFEGREFSSELRRYIETIEQFVGVPVGVLSFGPEREQVKFIKRYF